MNTRARLERLVREPAGIFGFLLMPLLVILSLVYEFGLQGQIFLYQTGIRKRKGLPCKVVSVGNISVGGTAKTPLVAVIARLLQERGYRAGILSRGYGRSVAPGQEKGQEDRAWADEPLFLRKSLPGVAVVVGKDRYQQAMAYLKQSPLDVVILDDGFQHWALKRDLDIVAIDARDGLGNRRLLPAGPLRERPRALRRADVIVCTKIEQAGQARVEALRAQCRNINPRAEWAEAALRPVELYRLGNPKDKHQVEGFSGKRVGMLSGIACPVSFRSTLESLGYEIALELSFPDHHHFTQKDAERIQGLSFKARVLNLVTTEKDAMRLEGVWQKRDLALWVLRVRLEITQGREELFERILGLCRS